MHPVPRGEGAFYINSAAEQRQEKVMHLLFFFLEEIPMWKRGIKAPPPRKKNDS